MLSLTDLMEEEKALVTLLVVNEPTLMVQEIAVTPPHTRVLGILEENHIPRAGSL